ncbi:hypothetical protein ABS71_12135 [bacterium SCN 62-11]|nr:MAG: hypothetical protein ABS71_12135 [bacterium SCN 62-11]
MNSWDNLGLVFDALARRGHLSGVQIFRRFGDEFRLLGRFAELRVELEFSTRHLEKIRDGKTFLLSRARILPVTEKGRVCGFLAVSQGSRPLRAPFCRSIASLVGHFLTSAPSPAFAPRQERAHLGFRQVLEKLVRSEQPVQVLRPLLLEMIAQVGANRGGLFLFDPGDHTLSLKELVSFRRPPVDLETDEFDSFTLPVPADCTPYWKRLVSEGQPLVLDAEKPEDESYFWPGTREWHLARGEKLVVSWPLLLGELALGFIALTFCSQTEVTPDLFEVAAPFAQEATLALGLMERGEKAREQLLRNQNEELGRVNETIQRGLVAVAAEHRTELAVGKLLQVVSEHLACGSSALWVYEPTLERFRVKSVLLDGEVIYDPARFDSVWPVHWDLRWRSHLEEKRPVVYRIAEIDPASERAFFERLGVQTLLAIPLISSRQTMGSFTMRFPDRRNFSQASLQLVQMLSHQATMVLQMQQLLGRVEDLATRAERSRLAGELHDTLSQNLVALVTHAAAASGCLKAHRATPGDLDTHLGHLERLARQCLLDARNSLGNLLPQALRSGGLSEALQGLIQAANAQHPDRCHFRLRGRPRCLSPGVEAELYRIAQECLQNSLRHAQASAVRVTLFYRKCELVLETEDDGTGAEPPDVHDGFGLELIQTRASRIGAYLCFARRPGRGTLVKVRYHDRT